MSLRLSKIPYEHVTLPACPVCLTMTTIPVVSFANFLSDNRQDREEVSRQVYDAFSSVGFIYLKDHGIPQARVDEIFALVGGGCSPRTSCMLTQLQAKTFFQLPLTEKLKYKLNDPWVNQGYTADGAEHHDSHKEAYEHRRFANYLCPDDSKLTGFKSTLDSFYAECLDLSLNVLRCLAMVMNLGDTFFDSITKRADPQLRLLHYPPINRSVIDELGEFRIHPHSDFGLCTLLFQDETGGLEIDPLHKNAFVPAPPIPGTVLINIADLCERFTNGRIKSTRHRVVAPKWWTPFDGDILPPRYSIPFFVHPDPETIIDPITLTEGEPKLYEVVQAGEWRAFKTAKNYSIDGPKLGSRVELEASS